ncbi:MAG: hypothetical protein ACLP5H_24675 [Desulfomonilaceae bacterium]
MQRALKVVKPEPKNPEIPQSALEPAPTTKLIAPSLGQLSEWKTWPPSLAMVDQVIPFMAKTSSEFRALQRIVNCSLRGLSLYIDLSECSVDSTLVDRFIDQRVLIPTDVQDTYLVNLYGCLQYFFSCLWNRPLTIKRHEHYARILETVQWDFDALDLPVVTLEIPAPKASPRPDKPHTVSVNPYRLADLTTSQVFEFIYRFWDVILENDDDLMNFFVMNRILELSIARKQIEPITTTADIIQYGQKGYSIGLPDLGSSAYVHRVIQQILDECRLRPFNIRRHQTNPYAYYFQFDPVLKKHCKG